MNGEAGVVLRRILAEDRCGVCNQFLELDKRCFDCDHNAEAGDEDNDYMNEPMDCRKCRRTDIPRKDLHWNTIGSYTDYCEECFQEEVEDDRQWAEKCRVIDDEEGVFEIPDFIKPCKTPCVPRPMYGGRSWWKLNGFNFDCHCAWKVEKEKRNKK